jgi:hypothetical protein
MMANVSLASRLSPGDLLDRPRRSEMDESGSPTAVAAIVNFDCLDAEVPKTLAVQLTHAATDSDLILIGRCRSDQVVALSDVAAAFTLTLVDRAGEHHHTGDADLPPPYLGCCDLEAAERSIEASISASPRAAIILAGLLQRSQSIGVDDALVAESLAYSLLLGSLEFARWRDCHPRASAPPPAAAPVLCTRDGDTLTVVMNQPERHNAFGRWMRDALCEALDLADVDDSIERIHLAGRGPSFCSGGDLDEFGTQRDLATGHAIRLDRSVGKRLNELSDRLVVELHGACIGAGIELPAFAAEVKAHSGTWFQLPELAMGLIPGAGGTVSLPRRIGRWRTAWMALSGSRLDLDTALAWGLVDGRIDA